MDMMEVYKHLTDQEREEYAALEETLSSKGWALIVSRAEATAEQLMEYGAKSPSWDENRIADGMRRVWESISRLREATDLEYAARAQERATPQEDDDQTDDPDYE